MSIEENTDYTSKVFRGVDAKDLLLMRTVFDDCSFVDCDFSGAELIEAKFNGVDLSSVKNISAKELQSAFLDSETKVPDYIKVHWKSEDTYECELV